MFKSKPPSQSHRVASEGPGEPSHEPEGTSERRDAQAPPALADLDLEATRGELTEAQHDRDAAAAPGATANALTSDERAAVVKKHDADPVHPPSVETVLHRRQVQSAEQANLEQALGQLDTELAGAKAALGRAERAAAVVRASALAAGDAADELHRVSAKGLGIPG